MTELPSGTVTFLLVDLVGSTGQWEAHPQAMVDARSRYYAILDEAVTSAGGVVFSYTGDGIAAAFGSATNAVMAAVDGQRALGREPWGDTGPLVARMGVHTGQATLVTPEQYDSHTLNRCSRLMDVAHGGQILVSDSTAAVAVDALADGVDLLDLGDHRLRDVARVMHIYQAVHDDLPSAFPPLPTPDSTRGNLPAQLSSFVGRSRELEEIATLLDSARVVTLTGVGGVGKTRLALEVAAGVLPRYRDGAWLVELAGVGDADGVVPAIATAIGAPQRIGTPVVDALTRFLRTKQLLLVLDNCEHVLNAVSTLVRTLERECRELVVLATSRERLGIAGERLITVRSLGESESVQLFVERALAVKDDFQPHAANLSAIGEVARRLDGIPLAIELAAARVSVLSPAQIARRLDQRFELLANGERGAVERHATLRAAIDWSFDLLSTEEQTVLTRLSVFAGDHTLEAAEVVCGGGSIEPGDVLDHLSALVSRSLVVADTSDPDETYYRTLATIRDYAEEHLAADDGDATRERHARYFTDWIAVALEGLQSSEQRAWFERVDREVDNLHTAVEWATSHGDDELACRMLSIAARPPLWSLPAGRAILSHADDALRIVRAPGDLEVDLLAIASIAAALAGRLDRANELSNRTLALTNGHSSLAAARAYAAQTRVATNRRDHVRALACWRHVAAWAHAAGTPFDRAWTKASLASYLAVVGRFEEARAAGEEALHLARGLQAPSLIHGALVSLAFASIDEDRDAARGYLIEAVALRKSFGNTDPNGHDVSLMTLGALLNEPEAVLWAARQVLYEMPAERIVFGGVLESLAAVVVPRWPERAATLHGAVDALVPEVTAGGAMRLPIDEAALPADRAARARALGAQMSEDDAAAYARTVIDDALQDRPTAHAAGVD